MENIIRKAIEGGYIRKNGSFSLPMKLNDEFDIWEYDHNAIVLDPLFWQTLGKACGWQKNQCSANYRTFMMRNYHSGWSKACEYLESITK